MFNVSNSVDSLKGPDPKTLIATERAQQKWDPVLMNYFLEGSKETSELNKRLVQQMERDPIIRANPRFYDLSKPEQRELTALKIDRISQYLEQDSVEEYTRRSSLISVFDPQLNVRIGVNLGLFLHCIRGNGTAEQLKFWSVTKEDKFLKGIYGCFAMTELAHGSNVAGLETTATFDKERDEFIINTPHIGATKWWIGGAAHSATHTACYARLIVDGKDYGVKTFIVPLRDSNHKLMPGVTVGDIGAKMGRDGIDNGWIQFSSVRVPRFFMLQKFCKVSREGEVTLPPLEQLSYSALLGGRVTMVMDSYRISARFTTVALRYAIGRRQFKTDGPEETQLLDYPLHQRRLLPYLALTYLISSGAYKLEATMDSVLNTLDEAVVKNDMKTIMKSINDMKSLFIDSASLKSTCTWLAADCIDQCRQACGGHGYSAYNGFGKAFNDWVVQCTWEGDNNVLALSVGKPLIRSIDEILNKGKKASGSISFLNKVGDYLNENNVLNSLDDVNNLEKNLLAIEVLIIRLCKDSLDTIKESKGKYEVVSAAMVTISKLKAHHYLLTEFLGRLNSADGSIKPYLELIAKLYTSSMIFDKFSGDFLTYSVISPKLMGKINQVHIPKLCLEIRPLTVNYTDSFQQSDMLLNAPIGNYNGDIYENYFNVVKQENNPFNTKAPYSAALEAMLNRSSLNDRERNEKSEEVKSILSK